MPSADASRRTPTEQGVQCVFYTACSFVMPPGADTYDLAAFTVERVPCRLTLHMHVDPSSSAGFDVQLPVLLLRSGLLASLSNQATQGDKN